MAKARALYICPATQAAIVAAAPAIMAGRDYDVTTMLLLKGVADPDKPTPFERSDAIRAGCGIRKFFEGIGTTVIEALAPADSYPAWAAKVQDALTPELLADVDVILVNGQAGTKQMSAGAWDGSLGATHAFQGRNLPVRRAFVAAGASISVQYDAGQAGIDDMTIDSYLQLYGFMEVDPAFRTRVEEWIVARRRDIIRWWDAKLKPHPDQAGIVRIVNGLMVAAHHPPCPWNFDQLMTGGYWLEAATYLNAKDFLAAAPAGGHVAAGIKIWDWAETESDVPERRDGRQMNHYEVDAAIMTGGILHLLECKNVAGGVTQEMIHKQGTLRSLLQGRGGVNAIITTKTPAPNSVIGLKAANRQIQCFRPTVEELSKCLGRIFPRRTAPR